MSTVRFGPTGASPASACRTRANRRDARAGIVLVAGDGAEAFHEQVLRSAGGAGVALHELARTGHAVDHPVGVP